MLARYGVELIGATIDTINAGEDRSAFKQIVTGLGAQVPASTDVPQPGGVRAGRGASWATRW